MDETGDVCAVAGTRLITYDTGLKTIFVYFGTGKRRGIWQHFLADILEWAKAQGCTLAEGSFRKGWRRVFATLLPWQHTHDFLERVL